MNPTYFGSMSQYRWRTSLHQSRPLETAYTTYEDAPSASQGVVSQAQDTLRESAKQLRPAMRRKPLVELQSNGRDRFGRDNSPSPRRTAALRTIRTYERERGEITTLALETSPSRPEPEPAHPREELTIRFGLSQPRKRQTMAPERKAAAQILRERLASDKEERPQNTDINPNKESRRRTIYVPDDTTVLTIHPGASITGKPLRRASLAREPQEPRRRSRAAGTRQNEDETTMTLNLVQEEQEPTIQIPAQSEAALPGAVNLGKKPRRRSLAMGVSVISRARKNVLAPVAEQTSPQDHGTHESESCGASRTALSSISANQKLISHSGNANIEEKKAKRDPIQEILARRHARTGSADQPAIVSEPKDCLQRSSSVKDKARGTVPKSSISRSQSQHRQAHSNPVFTIFQDDLACPELYEDNWLEHQEVALAQLLNAFFDAYDPALSTTKSPPDALRSRFIQTYNEPDMVHLVKRLQASLIYGSLMVPPETLVRSIRLKDDIGQRQRFFNYFLDTYNHGILQAAAEAIVGRQCSSTRLLSKSIDGADVDRRSLEHFLDTFFIQHKDITVVNKPEASITAFVKDKADQIGSQVWAWRRTVTRSLMLILILDKAKMANVFQESLFQSTSQLKSSEAVVKSVASMLLPSYGDVMRPLRHLKYDVSAAQTALEEFDYHVENLAADLRDGVRLARIVEIVLTKTSRNRVSFRSQLKYPCTARAQKLQNLMIVLGGLTSLRGIPEKLFRDVTAVDIVDGHREKTMSLLWALLGQYGMDYLIDKEMLTKEIQFFQATLTQRGQTNTREAREASLTESWRLLYTWARLICALASMQVSNLTTSFADGTAFEAVIKMYLPYFPQKAKQTSPSLGAKLRAIGCSTAFSALLSAPRDIIPTKDFTLTSLAFLAARLLPAAKTDRAARVLQRAYRRRLQRLSVTKRVALMRLAAHCAVVANARERVVGAAIVLQRAWRSVLENRRKDLDNEVTKFQSMARGWTARNRNKPNSVCKGRAGW